MPIDTLTARANTGAGTDGLAGRSMAGGFAGAVVGTNAAGDDWERLASEATLATIAGAVRAEDTPHVSGDTGIMALAVRADNETTLAIPDGDFAPLQVNGVGRLKVSTQPGLYDLVTGSITTNGQTVFCRVDRASNVMLHMVATSLVGHNVTFEGSINSTNGTDGAWFGIQAVRSNANTIETATGVLAATPAYAWEASVNGLTFVRVRATAHTSGTAQWNIQRGSYATEPIPAAQISGTQPVSGTVTATVGTSITGGTISPLTVAGVTIEASAARTATANGTTITNASGRGAMFYINVTAATGTTPTLVVQLQVQDPVSLNFIDVVPAATPSITATGLTMLTVCPGISEAANSRVAQGLPRTFRFRWTIGGTTPSFTFSIGAQYLI
jgi:hypothetical protein